MMRSQTNWERERAMMTTITRWVLAHRRWVAAFWVVVTIVGVASVGQATKAFSSEFSVPGRQGFETNSQIQRLFGQGGRTSPLIGVVTLPAGHVGELTGGPRRPGERAAAAAARYPGPADRVVCLHRQPRVRLRRRAHHLRARLPAAGQRVVRQQHARRQARPGGAGRPDDRRGAGPRHRDLRPAEPDRRVERAGRVPGVRPGRAGRARRPGLRVRLAAGLRPAADGDRLDHGHLPRPVGRHRA